MQNKDRQHIQDFWVVGINYKKTDASVRGLFAVNIDRYNYLLGEAAGLGISEFFILSTCNRTEIYGFAHYPEQLAKVLYGDAENAATFTNIAYTKGGHNAVAHLFQVGAGLDSQILGDYEILGQVKNAVKTAKAAGFIGPFLERLANSVIQASKAVKNHTGLSGGTVSVSFAAVQYIREFFEGPVVTPAMTCPATLRHLPLHNRESSNGIPLENKKIVIVGTGKIGRATCRNLVDYLQNRNITLINRTESTAAGLAGELELKCAPMESLEKELEDAEVILVSTNAQSALILKEHLEGKGNKLVIDCSVPCNVEPAAQKLPGITFVDVDMLSKIKDETFNKRKAEVPKATAIVAQHIAEFEEWYDMRKKVPVLKEVKNKLKEIYIDPILLDNKVLVCAGSPEIYEEKVQKILNSLATKIRRNNTLGCCYIEAINEFIS